MMPPRSMVLPRYLHSASSSTFELFPIIAIYFRPAVNTCDDRQRDISCARLVTATNSPHPHPRIGSGFLFARAELLPAPFVALPQILKILPNKGGVNVWKG